jgi:ribosomal protein S18 acetylase RimI-like enzyme
MIVDESVLEMRPALPEQGVTVLAILDAAAQRLLARGIQQWQSPPPQWFADFIHQQVAQGEVYIAWKGTTAVGTLRFEWQPHALWKALLSEDVQKPCGYIYTLAVLPSFAGRGVGQHMLAWAEKHVQARGCTWVRLDCMALNARLRHYYEQTGYAYCGEGCLDGFDLALYQKRLDAPNR